MKKIGYIIFIGLIGLGIFYLQFSYERTYHPHTYYQVYLDDEIIGIIESKGELDDYINKQGALIRNQVVEYQQQLETLLSIDGVIRNKLRNYEGKEDFIKIQDQYQKLSLLVDERGAFAPEKRNEVLKAVPEEFLGNGSVRTDSIYGYEAMIIRLEKYFVEEKAKIIQLIGDNQNKLSLTEVERHHLSVYASSGMDEVSYVKQVFMENYVEESRIYLYAEDIYSPLGINVKKINTYHVQLSRVSDVYAAIIDRKPCTIEGYQFRVKKSGQSDESNFMLLGAAMLNDHENQPTQQTEDIIIYVTDPSIFEEAVEIMEIVFVGSEEFARYKSGTQSEITATGTVIQDVYVEEDITVRKANISVREVIYTDANELSSYLLYGEKREERTVKASASETIPSLSLRHGISVEEFFLSNPEFTTINNMFTNGQEILIAKTDPKISVVIEKHEVEDRLISFNKVERYDSTMNKGSRYISQTGVNGKERISQNVRSVNGTITYVDPVSSTTQERSRDEITLVGTRNIPTVGITANWGWPVNRGYDVTSYYGWRILRGRREFHSGVDFSGGGFGAPVYASNNGVIITIERRGSYGNHILIDHNNGYYTLYAHMSRFSSGLRVGSTVSRGQQIGFIGSTGYSTGPHLHFEIRVGCAGYSCNVDPWPYLRR